MRGTTSIYYKNDSTTNNNIKSQTTSHKSRKPKANIAEMAKEAFPLHYLVWNNQYQELDRELQTKQVNYVFFTWFIASIGDVCLYKGVCALIWCVLQHDVEQLDPRARTPLELSVCLGHLESTHVLLRHNADPTHCNTQGWTGVLHVINRCHVICFVEHKIRLNLITYEIKS